MKIKGIYFPYYDHNLPTNYYKVGISDVTSIEVNLVKGVHDTWFWVFINNEKRLLVNPRHIEVIEWGNE